MGKKGLDHSWYEGLPENCPPENAISPEGIDLYRLVKTVPPTNEDFEINKRCRSNRNFRLSECITKSISLSTSIDRLRALKKLPLHRDEQIIKVLLLRKDGLIKQTFKDPSHHSWWRTKDFYLNQFEMI